MCFVIVVSKRDGEEQVVCEGTSVYDQQRCAHNSLQSGSLTVKPSMYHVQLLGFTESFTMVVVVIHVVILSLLTLCVHQTVHIFLFLVRESKRSANGHVS